MYVKKNIENQKGFTLVELLVVIAIIALLASIAIVALNKARENSRNGKRIGDIRQITAALEIYFKDNGKYPDNGTAGYDESDFQNGGYRWDSSCGGIPGNPNDIFLTPLSTGSSPAMKTLPDDPSSTNQTTCYLYSSANNAGTYINGYYLMAYLENATGVKNCSDLITQPAAYYTCFSQKH